MARPTKSGWNKLPNELRDKALFDVPEQDGMLVGTPEENAKAFEALRKIKPKKSAASKRKS